jgi:endonuclease/exonuclease/phosphatase (EEP) superfamily protein YafD
LIAEIFVALVLALTVLSLFARLGWPFELFSHFRPHFAVLGVIGTPLALAYSNDPAIAAISAFCALTNITRMHGSTPLAADASFKDRPGLTVIWANVWKKSEALQRTLDWARSQGADLILIGEFPAVESSGLAADYPNVFDTGFDPAVRGQTRIVAFSRLPARNLQVLAPQTPERRPFLKFVLDLPGGEALTVIPVHPTAPVTAAMHRDRNASIAMLGDLARASFLIAGDFNATPWSPVYPRIPGRRIGVGLWRPTWLTNLPLLGLPIDHIKVSPGIVASHYDVAPFLGSDHRALIARIHFAARTP